MNITIMRQVDFCAGHRLVGHEGKCRNLHGHNYRAELYITGRRLDSVGRVVDFAAIDRLFKGWIDENWDHGVLVWNDDRELIDALSRIEPSKIYLMPYNPTAENIARYLLTEIGPMLTRQISGYDVRLTRVVVWENDRSFAEASVAQVFDRPPEAMESAAETLDSANPSSRA